MVRSDDTCTSPALPQAVAAGSSAKQALLLATLSAHVLIHIFWQFAAEHSLLVGEAEVLPPAPAQPLPGSLGLCGGHPVGWGAPSRAQSHAPHLALNTEQCRKKK